MPASRATVAIASQVLRSEVIAAAIVLTIALGSLFPVWGQDGPTTPSGLADQTPPLRKIADLLALDKNAIDQADEVTIRGVVTFVNSDWDALSIQDASGGIFVVRSLTRARPHAELKAKQEVTLRGIVRSGENVPYFESLDESFVGSASLPAPTFITASDLKLRRFEGQRVRTHATARSVHYERNYGIIDLADDDLRFSAYVMGVGANDNLERLLGRRLSLSGVAAAPIHHAHPRTGLRVLLPNLDSVEVIAESNWKPREELTSQTLHSVLTERSLNRPDRRVRVTGFVTHHELGDLFWLQDETGGAMAISRTLEKLKLGDHVEVIGFPSSNPRRVVLEDASVRVLNYGTRLRPSEPANNPAINYGRFLTFEVDFISAVRRGDGVQLVLKREDFFISARLAMPPSEEKLSAWKPGSRLRISGVVTDNGAKAYRFLIPDEGQIELLSVPSSIDWTWVRNAAWVAVLVAAIVGLWIFTLRRTIAKQRERLRKQEELRRRLADLEKLDAIGHLASRVAHDFNNLLTGILGYANFARRKTEPNSEIATYLKHIESASTRAAEMTRQLLDHAKQERASRAPIDASRLVQEMSELLRLAIPSTVSIEHELADRPPLFDGNASQIRQIVMNLIINAGEAAEGQAEPIVRLSTSSRTVEGEVLTSHFGEPLPEGQYVIIRISDSGAGISPENLPRIFDTLFSTKSHGTGLGLTATREVCENHGAGLFVDSVQGEGTSISLYFPVAEESATRPSPPQPISSASTPNLKGKVLIIDDEPEVREFVREVIKDFGFDAHVAKDGIEGLEAFFGARESFAFVLLDLSMPRKTGLEVLSEIRAVDTTTRVVLMSGYNEKRVLASVYDDKATSFIAKPFTQDDLLSILSQPASRPS